MCYKTESVVEFAIGKQSGIGSDGRASKLERQSANRAVKRLELFAERVQIEHAIDLPPKMAGWDVVFQAEIVEQSLRPRLPPHRAASFRTWAGESATA